MQKLRQNPSPKPPRPPCYPHDAIRVQIDQELKTPDGTHLTRGSLIGAALTTTSKVLIPAAGAIELRGRPVVGATKTIICNTFFYILVNCI